ncbi:ribonuclease III [bacterium]|nr:ribonuclease III [bacterium]
MRVLKKEKIFYKFIMDKFKRFEKKINIHFKNKNLLKQAFVHRSYLNEHPNCQLKHNERLEFLGDAVLEFIVTTYLYNKFNQREGVLTNWRSGLVNTENLSKKAKALGFNDLLFLSKGEKKSKGKARKVILANTFEALIGAIYLDQGIKKCKKFIKDFILKDFSEKKAKYFEDAKSLFQKIVQGKLKITPVYKILNESGPAHKKLFEVAVYVGKKMIAKGKGSSKKEATFDAAKNALRVFK